MKKKLCVYKTRFESVFISECNKYYVSRSTAFTLILVDFYKRHYRLCSNHALLQTTLKHQLEYAKNWCDCNYWTTTISLNNGVASIFNKMKTYLGVSNTELYLMMVAYYVEYDFKKFQNMVSKAHEKNKYLFHLGITQNIKGKQNLKRN